MKITVVSADRLTLDHVETWSRWQRADGTVDSPFFRPEYTRAVAAVRSDVEVAILEDNGEVVGFFPFRLGLPRKGGSSLFRWLYRCCRRLEWFVKQKYFNRHIPIQDARQRGWELIADGEHGFGCRYYYVMPEHQIKQLEEAGFKIVAVFNGEGKSIDWRTPTEDHWLHYLCTPIGN